MLDKDFFSRYNGVHGKTDEPQGIPGFQMNKPAASSRYKGRLGLELEIEARSPTPNEGHLDALVSPTTKAKWTTVRDGSLRGDYAREYIVTKPINREELRYMLEGLFENFKIMKSKLDNSNRCSTHVHLNMGGRKINEITAIMCLWTVFEQALIAFNGEERMTNHFALSSTESNATLAAWEQYLRYGNFHPDRNLKYQAMNVLPIFEKGSLEIRCGAAANDAEGPIVWATLLDHLVDFACDNYSMLPRMGSDLSERGGSHIFTELCGRDPLLTNILPRVIDNAGGTELFNDSCLQGFRNCQPLVFGFPWEAWHKMIEKEYIPDPFAPAAPKGKIPLRGAGARPGRLMGEAPQPMGVPEWAQIAENEVRNRIELERERQRAARQLNAFEWNAREGRIDVVPRRAERDDPERPVDQPDLGIRRRDLNIQEGSRVEYIEGRQRPHGTRGTVTRIEGEFVFRFFVAWDDAVLGAPQRWCNRSQLRLVQEEENDVLEENFLDLDEDEVEIDDNF